MHRGMILDPWLDSSYKTVSLYILTTHGLIALEDSSFLEMDGMLLFEVIAVRSG